MNRRGAEAQRIRNVFTKQSSPRLGVSAVNLLIGLFFLMGVFLCLSVALGAVDFPLGRVAGILSHRVLGWPGPSWAPWEQTIVLQLRLPRALLAGLVGGALAIAGAACQGMFRNPLADPGLIGVTSGASLGAVAAIYWGLSARWGLALPAAAFAGALITALAVWAIGSRAGRASTTTLLLAGVAIGSIATAVAALILSRSLSYSDAGRQIVLWLMGGLEAKTWLDVGLAAPFVLGGALWMLFYARDLDALSTGEESALSLGVDVKAVRFSLLTLASLVTGAAVAVAGSIAFVGLIVPHVMRRLVGPGHRILLPASFLAGASLLTVADIGARTLAAPEELRLGVLTSLLGGPFFLFLLLRARKEVEVP